MPRVREVLLEQRVLYVSPFGSDLNLGMLPSEAIRTVQEAVNRLASLDHAIYLGTIRLDAGLYPGFTLRNHVGLGKLKIIGQGTQTVIEGEVSAYEVYSPWQVESLRIRCSNHNGLWLNQSQLMIANLLFESTVDGGSAIFADNQSGLYIENSTLAFNGAGGKFDSLIKCRDSSVAEVLNTTVNLGATPELIEAALVAHNLSLIRWIATVNGSAIGKKAILKGNSVIDLGSASANNIPGDGVIEIEPGSVLTSNAANQLGISPPPLRLRTYAGTLTAGATTGLQSGLPLLILKSSQGTQDMATSNSQIVVAPATYDFDSIEELEESPNVSFLIKNTGQKPLTVNQITIASGTADSFILTDGDCGVAPFTIAGGRACTVRVKFAPTAILSTVAEETRTARLVIESNAGNEAISEVSLVGKVKSKRGSLVWADDEYEMPSVEQGQVGTPITVSLRNPGKTSVPVAEIGLSGKDALAFTLNLNPSVNGCGLSPTLLPGDFCNVQLTASPPVELDSVEASVIKTCFLEARSSNTDISTAQTKIEFTATDRKPSLVVPQGDFISIPGVLTGLNTLTQNVTFSNQGTGVLEIYSIEVQTTGYANPITKALIEDPLNASPNPPPIYLEINTNCLSIRVNPFTVSVGQFSAGGLPPYEIPGGGSKTIAFTLNGTAIANMLSKEFGQYGKPDGVGTAPFDYSTAFSVAMFDVEIRHNDPEKGDSSGDSPFRVSTLTLAAQFALAPIV